MWPNSNSPSEQFGLVLDARFCSSSAAEAFPKRQLVIAPSHPSNNMTVLLRSWNKIDPQRPSPAHP